MKRNLPHKSPGSPLTIIKDEKRNGTSPTTRSDNDYDDDDDNDDDDDVPTKKSVVFATRFHTGLLNRAYYRFFPMV